MKMDITLDLNALYLEHARMELCGPSKHRKSSILKVNQWTEALLEMEVTEHSSSKSTNILHQVVGVVSQPVLSVYELSR